MDIVVCLLVIPATMIIGALVAVYHYGLTAVVLFCVLGTLYSAFFMHAVRGLGSISGRPSSDFDDVWQAVKDSLIAFIIISLTLSFYYAAVHFFKGGGYLLASFFLILTLMLPLAFVVTEGFRSFDTVEAIVVFLDEKNPFKNTYEKNDKALKIAFNGVLNNKKSIRSFVNISSKIAKNSPYAKRLSFQFANYSTKILINRIDNEDYDSAEEIVDNYIDNILPFAGYHIKSNDLASNALALSALNDDEKISQKVMDKLLGENFDLNTTNNDAPIYRASALPRHYVLTYPTSSDAGYAEIGSRHRAVIEENRS